jgi:hypothetical protein
MDGVSDLINGDAIIYLKFSSPIDVPITLSLIDEKLNYNGTELIDINSTIIGPYFKQYLFPNLTLTGSTPLTKTLTFTPNTWNYVEGILIGNWSCVKFHFIANVGSVSNIQIQSISELDVYDAVISDPYYDTLTFVPTSSTSLNLVLQYVNVFSLTDSITIKIDITTSTTV